MNITVLDYSTGTAISDDNLTVGGKEWGEPIQIVLRCRHDNIDVNDGVYCSDCRNEELTQEEVETFSLNPEPDGDQEWKNRE